MLPTDWLVVCIVALAGAGWLYGANAALRESNERRLRGDRLAAWDAADRAGRPRP